MALIGDNESISKHLGQVRRAVSKAQDKVEQAINTFTSSTTTTVVTEEPSSQGMEETHFQRAMRDNWEKNQARRYPSDHFFEAFWKMVLARLVDMIKSGNLTDTFQFGKETDTLFDGMKSMEVTMNQTSSNCLAFTLTDWKPQDLEWHQHLMNNLIDRFKKSEGFTLDKLASLTFPVVDKISQGNLPNDENIEKVKVALTVIAFKF